MWCWWRRINYINCPDTRIHGTMSFPLIYICFTLEFFFFFLLKLFLKMFDKTLSDFGNYEAILWEDSDILFNLLFCCCCCYCILCFCCCSWIIGLWSVNKSPVSDQGKVGSLLKCRQKYSYFERLKGRYLLAAIRNIQYLFKLNNVKIMRSVSQKLINGSWL